MITQSPRWDRSLRAITPLLLATAAFGLTACGGDDDPAKTTNAANATGSSGYGARGSSDADRTALQACLKKEGVTLPERPAGTGGPGGGYGGAPPTGTDGAPPTPPGGQQGQDGAPPAGGGPGGPPAGGDGQGRPDGGLPGGAGGGPGGRQLSEADRKKLTAAMEKCGGGRMGQGRADGNGRGRGQRPDVDDAAYRKSITAYVACVRKHGFDLPDPNFSGKGPIFDAKKVDQQDATFQKASSACQTELRPDRSRSAPTTTTPGTKS